MKLQFETGEIIEVNDEHLLKILKEDKRYSEVKEEKASQKKKDKNND